MGNTTSRRRLAGSILGALVASFGCAASPQPPDDERWVDQARGADHEPDSTESVEPREPDSTESAEPAPAKGVRDARAPEPTTADASSEPPESEQDAAPPEEAEREGGLSQMTPRDASDGDAPAVEDASGSTSDAEISRDAGSAPSEQPDPAEEPAGSCRQASDCTQPCVPIGLFNCCRASGTCGCTWAPGAYCS